MRNGLQVFDADAHVVEPFEVFRKWIDTDRPPMDLPPTTPMVPCGDFGVIADQMEHRFDAPSYLRAMDAQGIDAVVLYPSVGLFVPFQSYLSTAESADACRSYNRWVADYCATDGGRLHAVGLVPQRDPEVAATVAGEVAELGLTGVLVRPNNANFGDPAYAPLFSALEESGLVLAVHEGLGLRAPTIGSDRFDSFALRHACSHPLEQMAALAGLLLGGALERQPTLRVAVLESGTGWLPYWLRRLDDHAEWMRDECKDLTLRPSEYFARQCVTCSDPEDHFVAWAVGELGADHVMWASDFPHPDALFPTAVDEFVADCGLSSDALRSVLWDTPRAFYRLGG